MQINEIFRLSPVVPAVSIQDVKHALPLSHALASGGVRAIQVMLHTPVALDAIKIISRAIPTLNVGAGNVILPEQFAAAKLAGAQFAVSLGLTPPLLTAAKASGLPFLPGAMTPCEIMAARQMGFNAIKYFPAESNGGIETLKAIAAMFPDMQFCPMGGISRVNMRDYLGLKCVMAVSGTWLTPNNLVEEGNWDAITLLAKQATQFE